MWWWPVRASAVGCVRSRVRARVGLARPPRSEDQSQKKSDNGILDLNQNVIADTKQGFKHVRKEKAGTAAAAAAGACTCAVLCCAVLCEVAAHALRVCSACARR